MLKKSKGGGLAGPGAAFVGEKLCGVYVGAEFIKQAAETIRLKVDGGIGGPFCA